MYFGYKYGATANEDGEVTGAKLTTDDLYDSTSITGVDLTENTAEVKLKNGWGLLFAGMDSGTDYRLAEKISGVINKFSFELRGDETIVIYNLPIGTKYSEYTVAETDRKGYNLQHVYENSSGTKAEQTINREDSSVTGLIQETASAVSLLFENTRAPFIPFTGNFGVLLFYGVGALCLLAAVSVFLISRKKRITHVK